MIDYKKSSSYGPSQNELNDESLWNDLQVDFRLEALKFPDNKIYGRVRIIPEASRKLIRNFVLVINDSRTVEFDPSYEEIAVSGFTTDKRYLWAYVVAVPNNLKWTEQISHVSTFYFTGEVYALSPTITFHAPDNEAKGGIQALVSWYHLGDGNANRYDLFLDGEQIQPLRQKDIQDRFKVRICSFQPNEQHTIQLAALLSNGKETYRSDLIKFRVPELHSNEINGIECLTVFNEPAPAGLPIIGRPASPEPLVTFRQRISSTSETDRCCDLSPHVKFPGFDHYFYGNRQS